MSKCEKHGIVKFHTYRVCSRCQEEEKAKPDASPLSFLRAEYETAKNFEELKDLVDKVLSMEGEAQKCSCGEDVYQDGVCLVCFMKGNCAGESNPPL